MVVPFYVSIALFSLFVVFQSERAVGSQNVTRTCYNVGYGSGYKRAARELLGRLNPAVDPCDDFFEYACGLWNYRHPFTANQSTVNLDEGPFERVMSQAHTALSNIDQSVDALAKLSRIWRTCTDPAGQNDWHQSAYQLMNHVRSYGGWPIVDPNANVQVGRSQLSIKLATLKSHMGVDALFSAIAGPRIDDSDTVVLKLGANALLPFPMAAATRVPYSNSRAYRSSYSYYLNGASDPKMVAYKNLIMTVGSLLATDFPSLHLHAPHENDVIRLVNFEIQLARLVANSSSTNREARIVDLATLQSHVNGLDWNVYLLNLLNNIPLGALQLSSEGYLNAALALLTSQSQTDIQSFLVWRLIKDYLPYLGPRYYRALEQFEMQLNGGAGPDPKYRMNKCFSFINDGYDLDGMAMALARAYADKFPLNTVDATDMARMSVERFQMDMVANAGWLDASTKAEAMLLYGKMAQRGLRMGYPQWILNNRALNDFYRDLDIPSASSVTLQNAAKVINFSVMKNLQSLQHHFDTSRYDLPPIGFGLHYNPSAVSLTLPVGSLTSPYYDSGFPRSVNNGGSAALLALDMLLSMIPAIYGGQLFDHRGNANDWFSASSRQAIRQKAQCLAAQFSNFTHEGVHVNGQRAAPVIFADQAGLQAVFLANRKFGMPTMEPRLPGMETFTSDQLLFLGFAGLGCQSISPQALKAEIQAGVTPYRERVVGTIQNMPQFAQAFNCPRGSPMNPINKCILFQ